MFRAITISAILLITAFCAVAQSPVHWSITSPRSIAASKRGTKLIVQVTAQIDPGWHIYSITQTGGPIATRISLPAQQSFKSGGAVKGPRPEIKFDDAFGINTELYTGTAVFSVPVFVIKNTNGKKLVVNVRFQACNGEICLMPRTVELEL